ncbi:MAG: carboxypeptidase-like regulatory domain-containing protein, partial [Gammaproteobacteria bacterium]|nr:carboxypeptidase-like regulatory domain-containing protein [Gammaproteobacteria bacterium]
DENCDGEDAPLNPLDVDDDGDGFTENQGDCNDANAAINPDATDIPGNGIDENCDGEDAPLNPLDVDDDGDGFTENQGDCNDANAAINPNATEIPGNGIDENCDGEDAPLDPLDVDDDGDGFTENQGDCNDANAAINPNATDIPNNDIDENCDGQDATTGGSDTIPPSLSFLSPVQGNLIVQKRPAIAVSYDDENSGVDTSSFRISANTNTIPVDCVFEATSAQCAPTADLPEGLVTLVAFLEDNAGNPATVNVDVIVDSAPIDVSITAPTDALITKDDEVQVTGDVGDGVTKVMVNGVEATLGGSFSATVPLREGKNMIVAVAENANGKTGTDTVDITRDNVAPIVRIDSPRDGFVSVEDKIAIAGKVNDIVNGATNARVLVNGIEATVADGAFMVVDLPLVRGPNTLEAVATDAVGNIGRHAINVTFQKPAGARIGIAAGNGQAAFVNQQLPEPLVVEVKDDLGNPVAGRVMTFEVTRNSGMLKVQEGDTPKRMVQIPTNGSGQASVLFALGDTAGEGNNRVKVIGQGVAGEGEFCASALGAQAEKILMVMGDNQRGLAGHPLSTPLEALVVDEDGNPVKDLPVTFAVVRGTGNLNGEENVVRVTGTDGIARAVLTLGVEPGINNIVVNATFAGLTGLPATFVSSALLPGNPEETSFRGVVLDNAQTPIPGAIVSIPEANISSTTDEEGQFQLTQVPVGHIHLRIDPTNSPRPETFPPLEFETVTVAGQVNILGQPILIPALQLDSSKTVGGNQDVTLTMPGVAGLTLTVFANSATFPDGSKISQLTISQVHLDKVPMPPPSGTIFMPPAWTIQPAGAKFDPPAKITIPNDGLPAGRVIDIFQFDHALNEFINIGKGTVSEDASIIVSDPGFGVTRAGWGGCGQPQPPTTCASGCDDGNPCTDDKCENNACVHTNKANGSTCDDGNSCTKNTTCSNAGVCEGGDNTMNTTGSDADKKAWRKLLDKCKQNKTLKKICEDPDIGMTNAKVGRDPGIIFDSVASDAIDLDDLEAVDKLRCSWSMDSCQDIIHFMRERLSCLKLDCTKNADFKKAHEDGFKDETDYRKEKGWPGIKTGCHATSTSPLKAECTYDDDGDGKTDRTEIWDFDSSSDLTKVTCKPAK